MTALTAAAVAALTDGAKEAVVAARAIGGIGIGAIGDAGGDQGHRDGGAGRDVGLGATGEHDPAIVGLGHGKHQGATPVGDGGGGRGLGQIDRGAAQKAQGRVIRRAGAGDEIGALGRQQSRILLGIARGHDPEVNGGDGVARLVAGDFRAQGHRHAAVGAAAVLSARTGGEGDGNGRCEIGD